MPRSRKRKGVRKSGRSGKGMFDLGPRKQYYGPGEKPQPRNLMKAVVQKPYRPKGQRGR